jgi:hypothetical protein
MEMVRIYSWKQRITIITFGNSYIIHTILEKSIILQVTSLYPKFYKPIFFWDVKPAPNYTEMLILTYSYNYLNSQVTFTTFERIDEFKCFHLSRKHHVFYKCMYEGKFVLW